MFLLPFWNQVSTQILGQNLISLSLYYVGFLLCFQWNRQRKSVAYGHPRVHVFLLQRTQTRLHSPYFPTPKCIHYMTDDIREASWRWRQEHTQLASYPFKSWSRQLCTETDCNGLVWNPSDNEWIHKETTLNKFLCK